MHEFFALNGHHVCDDAESFRVGYCAACDDVIESEGLCGHGSYPDNCGECADEEFGSCGTCGDPIDYCIGHGTIG